MSWSKKNGSPSGLTGIVKTATKPVLQSANRAAMRSVMSGCCRRCPPRLPVRAFPCSDAACVAGTSFLLGSLIPPPSSTPLITLQLYRFFHTQNSSMPRPSPDLPPGWWRSLQLSVDQIPTAHVTITAGFGVAASKLTNLDVTMMNTVEAEVDFGMTAAAEAAVAATTTMAGAIVTAQPTEAMIFPLLSPSPWPRIAARILQLLTLPNQPRFTFVPVIPG